MKTKHWLSALSLGIGLILAGGFFVLIGRAAPANPEMFPLPNSHTALLTTTVSITYNEPISATTVTSRTFAVHGMQSGLVTATHGVRGNSIIVTPTYPFHQGELVYVVATTRTLGLDGTEPVSATQWQFRGGEIRARPLVMFTGIDVGLPGVNNSSVAWGDYDRDGDLDVLITGRDAAYAALSRVYRNDGGSFTDIGAGLANIYDGAAAWGDYDNDGDLDILLAGSGTTRVYRNNSNHTFTDIGAGLPNISSGSAAWGDYDNDGDLDILLTGYSSGSCVSRIYRNNGNHTFTNINAALTGVYLSSAVWGGLRQRR